MLIMRIIIIVFCWVLLGVFLYIGGNQYICKLKFLGLYKVEGEITGFDEVPYMRSPCKISIITYQIYDMKYKTFIIRSCKDRMGDKVYIMTNSDISIRTKTYMKDISLGVLVYCIGMLAFLGWMMFEWSEVIDIIGVLIAMGSTILWLIVYPYMYIFNYHSIKKHFGYLYRY